MDVRLVGDLLEEHAAGEVGDAHVELQHGLAGRLEVAPAQRERVALHAQVDVLGGLRDGWRERKKREKEYSRPSE